MSHELDPKVGRWYRRLDDEQLFKVVSLDEDEGLVEIKTVDGDIEELDSTEWVELDLEAAEAPEDYVDQDEKKDEDEEESEDWDDDDDEDDDDLDEDDDDEDYDSDRRSAAPPLVALRSLTPQPLELLEQIERQRGSREIDTEVVLQAKRTLHARQRNTGETPLRAIGSRRLDDTFRDDLDDELLGDAACRAYLVQAELDGIV